MHKYSFTFLLVVLITLTGKSQNLDLIKSSLNHFQKEFHHKSISSNKWNETNLRIAQNSGKKLDSLVQENWNVDLQDWEYSGTAYFYYDQNGRPSRMSMEITNPITTIAGTFKISSIFDELASKVTWIYAFKFPESEEWFNDAKIEYAYDQNGRLKEEVDYYWSDDSLQYVADRRWEYFYNEKGQLVREIGYEKGIDGWYISENYEYLYDITGNLTTKNHLLKKYDSEEFYLYSYVDYVKINSQLSEEQEYQKFNPEGNWKQISNRKLYYDVNGNLVNDSTFSNYSNLLDFLNAELVRLDIHEYDLSVDVSEVNLFSDHIWDPLQLESMANQPTVDIQGFWDDDFMIYSKMSYYFSEGSITNTENLVSKTFTIYPNPTQSVLNIDGLEDNQPVTILNIDGTQVSTLRIQNGKIPTQGLMPGMYILDLGDQKLKFGVTK